MTFVVWSHCLSKSDRAPTGPTSGGGSRRWQTREFVKASLMWSPQEDEGIQGPPSSLPPSSLSRGPLARIERL